MSLRTAPVLVAGLLLLGACTGPFASPPPSTSPASGQPATDPASATASPQVPPAAPSSAYTTPLPLPAADGGPMLWPAATDVSIGTDDLEHTTRYGFVNADGVLVVPPLWESYAYCRDAAGRIASVVVTAAGRRAAVLELSGKIVRTLPTRWATCGPAGTAVFTQEHGMDDERWEDGLFEVATGRVLLPLAPKQHLAVVDDRTVDVSISDREYFFDTVTRRRTPHPGEVEEPALETGAPGVPATVQKGRHDVAGFVDTAGHWVIAPTFGTASPFVHGFAEVEPARGGQTFIDTHGKQVGGDWAQIEDVAYEVPGGWRTVGYLVTGTAGKGLLDLDLRTVVEPLAATITCEPDAFGACAVVDSDGHASLVVLPQGTVTAMPDGFDHAISPAFTGRGSEYDQNTVTQILFVGSGVVADFGGEDLCSGVGSAWAVCEGDAAGVILDAQGRRTAFGSIVALYDVGPEAGVAYYWATTGRWEGIVDASGTWHYRQSRFTRLED